MPDGLARVLENYDRKHNALVIPCPLVETSLLASSELNVTGNESLERPVPIPNRTPVARQAAKMLSSSRYQGRSGRPSL